MRLGVLGAGGIVRAHLAAAARHPRVRIVRICDVRREAAQQLAEEFGIDRVSTDAAEVLADRSVDAVVVALPTYLHAEWLLRCAEAGKHILTEKPLCRTVAEGRTVLQACAERGVRLAVGYQRRFSPARVRARELVRTGALGRPVTWTLSSFGPRSDFYRGPGNWMWDIEKGGGLVMDGSIHDFDFASWVLGRPAAMFAQSQSISKTVTAPTQASAIVRFADGDTLVYGAAWPEGDLGLGSAPYSIVGPEGTVVMDSEFSLTWHSAPGKRKPFAWNPNRLRPEGMGGVWLFYRQLDAFERLARGETVDDRLATGAECLSSLWIAENIVRAGPAGSYVEFAAGEEKIP